MHLVVVVVLVLEIVLPENNVAMSATFVEALLASPWVVWEAVVVAERVHVIPVALDVTSDDDYLSNSYLWY